MVGLGPGARSYTRGVHYSSDFAVNAHEIKGIIGGYTEWTDDDLARAHFGYRLDEDEQMRRFLIQSLLSDEGLSGEQFHARFGSEVQERFPELSTLLSRGLAHEQSGVLRLTAEAYGASDAIGPWLYSETVKQKMAAYEAR